jgi:WD40 repeat protein
VVFSPSGSFVATSFGSMTGDEHVSTIASYELETMSKTQSVVTPGSVATCVAVSPDSKQTVYSDHNGRIRIIQTDDFSNQRDLDKKGEVMTLSSVAFDPAYCRILAFGCHDGRLELRNL